MSGLGNVGADYFDILLNNNVGSGVTIAQALQITTPQPPSSVPPLYISLHTGDPGNSGSNETSVAGYQRASYQRTLFSSGGSNFFPWTKTQGSSLAPTTWTNYSSISFATVSGSDTITHWGIWTALTGGGFILGGPLRASGASVKLAYATAVGTIHSVGHGLTAGNTIRVWNAYDNFNGGTAPLTTPGVTRVVDTGPNTDDFDITVNLDAVGPVGYVLSGSLSLVSGSVPSIAAGGIVISVT
jgi:hypothetical protein